jgi:hypothetical protein
MDDCEKITEWPTYSDASRKQRQVLAAREQQEPLPKIAIANLAGRIMVFVGGAYALYSVTKIVAWMVE